MAVRSVGTIAPVAAAVSLVAAAVGAQSEAVPIRVSVSAPPGCLTNEAFFDAVRERTARVRPASDGESARLFDARLRRVGTAFEGALTVDAGDGDVSRREVRADSCQAVRDALALIAALTIDPNSAIAPPATADATEDVGPPSQPAATTPAPVAQSVAPRPDPPADLGPRPLTPSSDHRLGLALHAETGAAAGPWPTLTAGAGIRWSTRVAPGWVPRIELSAHRATRNVTADGEEVRFERLTGRLSLSPAVAHVATVELRPLLALDVGRLSASARIGSPAREERRPWFGAIAALNAEARLTPALSVGVAFGAEYAIMRDNFVFIRSGRDVVVRETPPVALLAGVLVAAAVDL